MTRFGDLPKPVRSGLVVVDPVRGTPERVIVDIIQAWASRMDIDFYNETTKEHREQQLLDAIRKRMIDIYHKSDRSLDVGTEVG